MEVAEKAKKDDPAAYARRSSLENDRKGGNIPRGVAEFHRPRETLAPSVLDHRHNSLGESEQPVRNRGGNPRKAFIMTHFCGRSDKKRPRGNQTIWNRPEIGAPQCNIGLRQGWSGSSYRPPCGPLRKRPFARKNRQVRRNLRYATTSGGGPNRGEIRSAKLKQSVFEIIARPDLFALNLRESECHVDGVEVRPSQVSVRIEGGGVRGPTEGHLGHRLAPQMTSVRETRCARVGNRTARSHLEMSVSGGGDALISLGGPDVCENDPTASNP